MTTDTADLAAAIAEFEAALPGWWWSVGHCSLSRDASCGPDFRVVGPDQGLAGLVGFTDGFHWDDRAGTLANSLRNVMRQALSAKARHAREPFPAAVRKRLPPDELGEYGL